MNPLQPLENRGALALQIAAGPFGPRLRMERERRRITLDSIAANTKISVGLLKDLEEDNVSRWPAGIYRRSFIKAYAPQSNLDLFSEVAASSGYFSLRSDQDGVLRWMPLVIQSGEDLFPPLSVACAETPQWRPTPRRIRQDGSLLASSSAGPATARDLPPFLAGSPAWRAGR